MGFPLASGNNIVDDATAILEQLLGGKLISTLHGNNDRTTTGTIRHPSDGDDFTTVLRRAIGYRLSLNRFPYAQKYFQNCIAGTPCVGVFPGAYIVRSSSCTIVPPLPHQQSPQCIVSTPMRHTPRRSCFQRSDMGEFPFSTSLPRPAHQFPLSHAHNYIRFHILQARRPGEAVEGDCRGRELLDERAEEGTASATDGREQDHRGACQVSCLHSIHEPSRRCLGMTSARAAACSLFGVRVGMRWADSLVLTIPLEHGY